MAHVHEQQDFPRKPGANAYRSTPSSRARAASTSFPPQPQTFDTAPHSNETLGHHRIPVGFSCLIFFAAIVIATLVSLAIGELTWPFLLIVLAGGLISTLCVEARGLFVTVACQPFLAIVFTPFSAWLVAVLSSSAPPLAKTTIAGTFLPLSTYFPWFLGLTIVCIILALARYALARNSYTKTRARAQTTRSATLQENRRTLGVAQQAREVTRTRRSSERSTPLTVSELLARNQQSRDTRMRPPRTRETTYQRSPSTRRSTDSRSARPRDGIDRT